MIPILLAIFFLAGFAIGRVVGLREGQERARDERRRGGKVIDIRPPSNRSAR